MQMYCAQSWVDGRKYEHTYPARDGLEATEIAAKMGWDLLGELVAEQIIYADELEQILRGAEVVH